jgi:hypothetical protein
MRTVALIPVVCCWLAGSSAWAIDCMSAPGDPKTGWYAWREIEGRRCWFKKTGGMPPKSQLHWVAKAEREPPAREREGEPASPPPERPAPVAVPMAVPPAEADTAKPQPKAPTAQFRTVRVRPATAASVRPGNGQVSDQIDLLNGTTLSSMPALGSARQKPARVAPADAFDARFKGQ